MWTDAYYRLNGDKFSWRKNVARVAFLFSLIYQLKCSLLIHTPPSYVEYGIVLVPFLQVDLLAPGDSYPLVIPGFIFPGVTFVLTGLMRWSPDLNGFYVDICFCFCPYLSLPQCTFCNRWPRSFSCKFSEMKKVIVILTAIAIFVFLKHVIAC